MKRYAQLLLAPLLLAACTADPGGTNTDFGMTTNPAPATVAGALQAVDYDADAGELVLTLNAVHGGERNVTYVRTAAVDTNGYQGYTLQRSPADRHYTALFGESADNELYAGVVADGGNNNRYFGGGVYGRQGLGVYSPYDHAPTEGEVQYRGDYAGVTNVANSGTQLLDSSGLDPNLTPPRQSDRVTGIILLNADFENLQMDAEISNRQLVDDLGGLNPLPDVILVPTAITAEGTFEGTVEYEGVVGSQIGSYAGLFGGAGATSVAGVVYLEEFDGTTNRVTGEEEYGVFIMTRCGAAGAHPDCPSL